MTALLAADSWLVADGRARAVERHWARFSATCREQGVAPDALAAFRAEVAETAVKAAPLVALAGAALPLDHGALTG